MRTVNKFNRYAVRILNIADKAVFNNTNNVANKFTDSSYLKF